jgi:adenylate cyclase
VAVVRLRSSVHGTDDRRVATALSESLVHALTRASVVRVAGPFESATGSRDRVDVYALGARSRASAVLHGRVRQLGDVVRVTVQLADTATGEVRWSDEFDRPTSALLDFGGEDEIIARIVAGTVATVDAPRGGNPNGRTMSDPSQGNSASRQNGRTDGRMVR